MRAELLRFLSRDGGKQKFFFPFLSLRGGIQNPKIGKGESGVWAGSVRLFRRICSKSRAGRGATVWKLVRRSCGLHFGKGGAKEWNMEEEGALVQPASLLLQPPSFKGGDREIERQAANQRKGEKGREKKKLFLEEGATTGKKERRREGGGAKDRNLIKMKPIPFLVRFWCAGLGNGGEREGVGGGIALGREDRSSALISNPRANRAKNGDRSRRGFFSKCVSVSPPSLSPFFSAVRSAPLLETTPDLSSRLVSEEEGPHPLAVCTRQRRLLPTFFSPTPHISPPLRLSTYLQPSTST